MSSIRIQPGALDAIPLTELARFLAQHGLELVYKPDGLTVRAAPGTRGDPDRLFCDARSPQGAFCVRSPGHSGFCSSAAGSKWVSAYAT